jgi:hypothetical protein
MFQVCCNTWNSSLNRRELFEHLRIAESKGGMVFQAAEAETTRRFLKAILEGKGLPAECTLKNMPSSAAIAAATTAAATVVAKESAAAAGLALDTNAITAAGMAHMLPLQPTLQTLPDAHSLFQEALSRAEPLWFHLEQPSIESMDAGAADIKTSPQRSNDAVERNDTLQLSHVASLTFVQFVSIAQPAYTSTTPALPSVVIFNSPTDVHSHSLFGRLDAAAAARFSRVLAAAADAPASRFAATVPRKRVRHQKLRSPPREIEDESEDDIVDTSSSLASSGSALSHRKSRLTAESLPLHRLAQLSALLYCSDDHSTALSE